MCLPHAPCYAIILLHSVTYALQASGLSEGAGGGDDSADEAAGSGGLNLQLLDVSESVDDLDDAVAQGAVWLLQVQNMLGNVQLVAVAQGAAGCFEVEMSGARCGPAAAGAGQ